MGVLISNLMPAPMAFVSTVILLLFLGMIDTRTLLAHYTNQTLITLILLLQVSYVVEKTVVIPMLSRTIFSSSSLRWSLAKLSGLAVLLSSHLNNTAIVASLMGTIRTNPYISPSKLLIPLSYASIIGGVLTLVGTSTNLIVNSFLEKGGFEPILFYDFIYIGAPIAIIGLLYVIFVLPRMLPDNGKHIASGTKTYFLEAKVMPRSRLIGRSVNANGLRNMDHLFLVEIVRRDNLISPVTPEEILQAGDVLVFAGDIKQMQELRKFDGLVLYHQRGDLLTSNLQEVVVRHNAPIIGYKIKEAQFRTKFDAVVVAIKRGREKLSGKIGYHTLQPGDNLVLAVGNEYQKHENLYRHFIQISSVDPNTLFNKRESVIAIALFVGGIGLAAFNVLTLFKIMVIVLLAYLAMGFLKLKELKNTLNLGLLLMIGSSLALSDIIATYGVDRVLSNYILTIFGMDSPYWALAGVYLTTVILTELITNNAAAALVFPIAISAAHQLDVNHMPFVMAIAYAASASFLTPIGYQTNTMIFSIGNYRFTDFLRGGISLSLLYGIIVLLLIPYFFPF